MTLWVLQKAKQLLLKFLSLFSAVRGYNILVLIAAQYLAAIFIFSPTKSLTKVLFDIHLLLCGPSYCICNCRRVYY